MTAKSNHPLTTFRWPDDLASDARLVASVDGVSVSDLIRGAVAAHIALRRDAPEFQSKLRRHIESSRRLLDGGDGQ